MDLVVDDNKPEIEVENPVSNTDSTNSDSKVENSVEVSNFYAYKISRLVF